MEEHESNGGAGEVSGDQNLALYREIDGSYVVIGPREGRFSLARWYGERLEFKDTSTVVVCIRGFLRSYAPPPTISSGTSLLGHGLDRCGPRGRPRGATVPPDRDESAQADDERRWLETALGHTVR